VKLLVRIALWITGGGLLAGALLMTPAGPLAGPAPRALAANVDIILNADPDDVISLNLVGAGCPANLAAGDVCTATVAIVNNDSTFAIDYTASAAITSGAECDAAHAGPEFTAEVTNFVDTIDHPGTDDVRHMPKNSPDAEQFDVVVRLDAGAGNSCQSTVATVVLTVEATDDTIDPQNKTDVHIGSHACDGPFDSIITGTSASETLRGTSGRNKIAGNGGNDTIIGGPKDDCIITGDGNDTISGDQGNDEITAGHGTNTINSGPGNDTINAGNGNDTINAGEGHDYVDAGQGTNSISAGPHNDLLHAGDGNDTLDGESGIDGCFPGLGVNAVVNCEY
jgi:Ca2+-binding RTX toxin-like protein